MRENFLHYVWRMKQFRLDNLQTTRGEPIQVIDVGRHNDDAGPDFLEARIQIGDTKWVGNVEMHLQSSEWIAHQHQKDKAYDNVILHVVLDEDVIIRRKNGGQIPCLELRGRIPSNISTTYHQLQSNAHWIPCQQHWHAVSDFAKAMWLDRLLVERLEQKTVYITQLLARNNNNWEDTFYQVLARNFGLKVNAEPFEQIANRTPHNLFAKHKTNLFQIEALLFGQAGLLNDDFEDDYPNALKKEYLFLKGKYDLAPLKKESWRFLRMRPANFPTIRIAQFATLIHQSLHLFSKILEVKTLKDVEGLFHVTLSDYWLTHYIFDKATPKRKKSLGKGTIHLLTINAIAPTLFLYGTLRGIDDYKDLALRLLEAVQPEKNSIISQWQALGMKPTSAYQTQALLQLKNMYCSRQKCLECAVGNAILAKDV